MRIIVLCPHMAPDTAPTGVVMTRIVQELAARGHQLHVVTALPWYRAHAIERGWGGRMVRRQATQWGTVTRVHPFPAADKRDLVRRAAGFAGFSVLAGLAGLRAGGWFRQVDVVLAMSPPLTLGPTGWLVGLAHRAPFVFNIQDVFPDAAVRTGALTNRRVIAVAGWLERFAYRRSAAVTVLSEDLAGNVRAKLGRRRPERVTVIPNFVDTDAIRPGLRATPYRAEMGLGERLTVMYAGNVGFSQSLDLLLEAARRLPHIEFVVNGDGTARSGLEAMARRDGLANVHFAGYQPVERMSELLASADVSVVPLKAGLGAVSVPSKTYSILASGRPVVASIDPGTEIPRILAESGGGVAVPPDDPDAFCAALADLLADPERRRRMGEAARAWAVANASPAAVAAAYDALLRAVASHPRG